MGEKKINGALTKNREIPFPRPYVQNDFHYHVPAHELTERGEDLAEV